MKQNLRITVLLLAAALVWGCGTKKRSTLESYRNWPTGLSVSLLMPAEKLQQVKDAGLGYVEVTLNSQRKTGDEERHAAIERFRADAERTGLTVWSVHLPFGRDWDISTPDDSVRRAVVERFAWFIEAVKPLKPGKLVLHPSYEPIADSIRAQHIEACIASTNELAAAARAAGMQLLLEDLPRTCLGNTSQEMLAILERVDPAVGVCFDTNHLLQETPEEFARAMGGRIASLHVSDYDRTDEKHWLMGRGTTDWPAVIAAIAQSGYDGVFMFEVGGYDTFGEITDSWHAVEKQLETGQQQ